MTELLGLPTRTSLSPLYSGPVDRLFFYRCLPIFTDFLRFLVMTGSIEAGCLERADRPRCACWGCRGSGPRLPKRAQVPPPVEASEATTGTRTCPWRPRRSRRESRSAPPSVVGDDRAGGAPIEEPLLLIFHTFSHLFEEVGESWRKFEKVRES